MRVATRVTRSSALTIAGGAGGKAAMSLSLLLVRERCVACGGLQAHRINMTSIRAFLARHMPAGLGASAGKAGGPGPGGAAAPLPVSGEDERELQQLVGEHAAILRAVLPQQA